MQSCFFCGLPQKTFAQNFIDLHRGHVSFRLDTVMAVNLNKINRSSELYV